MKRACLVVLFALAIVGNSFGWYDPKVGRWLSRDPAAEVDTPNLYTYVKNDPVNSFDPFGLWTVQFNGNNWTPERKNYFNARMSDVTRGIPQMITRTDQLIAQAEKISDGCCLKQELLKDLKGWKKNLLQVMDRRQKGSVPLPVSVADLGLNDGMAHFFGIVKNPFTGTVYPIFGNDLHNFQWMDVAPNFFDNATGANETLFHELSHISGTVDWDGKEPVSTLWNAVEITYWISSPSTFTPAIYWDRLKRKYNDAAGCSQTDKRWPKN